MGLAEETMAALRARKEDGGEVDSTPRDWDLVDTELRPHLDPHEREREANQRLRTARFRYD
jgi:hypothetical protein